MVPKLLKLPQLREQNGMTQVEIGGGWIESSLHLQGLISGEFL
jgi:hypothetical protein